MKTLLFLFTIGAFVGVMAVQVAITGNWNPFLSVSKFCGMQSESYQSRYLSKE